MSKQLPFFMVFYFPFFMVFYFPFFMGFYFQFFIFSILWMIYFLPIKDEIALKKFSLISWFLLLKNTTYVYIIFPTKIDEKKIFFL